MTDESFKELQGKNLTWRDVMQMYQQPDWCTYQEALAGVFGCWSLVYLHVHTIADCVNCELTSAVNSANYCNKISLASRENGE